MNKLTPLFFFLHLGFLFTNAQRALPPKPYGPLPSAAQLNWQEMEMYCIVHFGLDTYTDKEWGYGDEDPALFNPAHFDAAQIAGAAKAGGFKGILVVAKHHDGFCLWPTTTTEHNITRSPYLNGKGDIVKEYEKACKKLGMQMGIYCSPWDRNSPLYGTSEYVAIYRKQLQELYINYGKIFTSWHDGANGGDGYYGGAREKRLIDKEKYYGWDSTWNMTRKLQPSAAIFSDIGWDIRWVGNEEGEAGLTSWATYTPHGREDDNKPGNGNTKYWEATEGHRNGKYWMPAECDVSLRPGWFYHANEDDKVKSRYTLFDLYFKSVGRGADLDLGLSPNRDGRLQDADVKALKDFGELLQKTFSINLAKGALLKPSNVRANDNKNFGAAYLLDNDRYSYWATDDSVQTPSLELLLNGQKTFNIIRLRENIKLGQRIEAIAVDVWKENNWVQIAQATSIGANRLIRLSEYVTTNKVRLRVIKSPVCIALSDIGFFTEPIHLTVPIINRNKKGYIILSTISPVNKIRYTTDGSDPDSLSKVYEGLFSFKAGGIIKVKSFDLKGNKSETSIAHFGISKEKWKIFLIDSFINNNKPEQAIDDDPVTIFQNSGNVGTASIAIDLGEEIIIKGFTYLPRQQGTGGIADKYQFDISSDGKNWVRVATGEFSNIRSNPIEQVIILPTPVKAKFFKFTALHLVDGHNMSVAELGVINK